MPREEKESLKSVRVELIPENKSIYKIMNKVRKKYHRGLKRAKIALVWKIKSKPDKDGHLELGKCHKASDLQKELSVYDFVISLNKEAWNEEKFTKKMKYALIDHELCHAAPSMNKSGHQKKDVRGRYCFRMRDHDIEEFREIVERHGVWKRDLELFAEALLKRRKGSK